MRQTPKHIRDAIEIEYCLGQKSMGSIAKEFKVDISTVSRLVKRYKWKQTLAIDVQKLTEAGLLQGDNNTPTQEDIDRAVRTNIEVIRGHRKDIATNTALVDLLASQLKDCAENRDEYIEDILCETAMDEYTKRRNRMLKAVSLPMHASILRDLSTTLKNLIPLERQAFNLDAKQVDEDTLEARLRRLHGG